MSKLWNFEDLPFKIRIRLKQPFDRKLFKNINVGRATRDYWIRENSFPFQIIKNSKNYEKIKPLITHIKGDNGQLWISINCIQELTPELARVLARLVGDGSVNSMGRIEYGSQDKVFIDSFIEEMKILFPDIKPHVRYWEDRHMYELLFNAICGSLLRFIFGEFGTYKARIPKQIIQSNRKIKSAYLQALYDDEGTVNLKAHQIVFSLVNKELTEDIKILLNEFCIDVKTFDSFYPSPRNKNIQYVLNISHRKNIEKFAVYIGFDKKSMKTKKLSKLLESYPYYRKYHVFCLKILIDKKANNANQISKIIVSTHHAILRVLNRLKEEGLVDKQIINYKVKPWNITQKGIEYYNKLSFYL